MSQKLFGKKGQLGPQGLEDLPMTVMAFIIAVAAMIILFKVTAAHGEFSGVDDVHAAGKRLIEALSGEAFKSEESRAYGEEFIDWDVVKARHDEDPSLRGLVGYIEYSFWARVDKGSASLEFGEEPPNTTLAYAVPVPVLYGDEVYNGKVEVRIWE